MTKKVARYKYDGAVLFLISRVARQYHPAFVQNNVATDGDLYHYDDQQTAAASDN